MSGSPRAWRMSERILLLAVVVFALLAIIRLVSGPAPTAAPAPGAEGARPADRSAPPDAGPPPSPAAAELLARIRSCSEQDLQGIVDKMSAMEALSLNRTLSSSDRQAVLSAIPAPILARKAQTLLGVPEGCFRATKRPGLLAATLVEAAMGTPAVQVGSPPAALGFATAIDEQNAPQSPRAAFRPDERRIYACFDGGDEPGAVAGVLVRWSLEGSVAPIYLQYLPFAINRRWNYVYYEAAAWAPGTYRVSFHRIGQTVSLLAEGTYVVGAGN